MDNSTMVSYAATCLILSAIFSVILRFRLRRHLYDQASKFPGPPTLPIIGNAHLFAGSTEDILDRIIQLGKVYPAPYRLWFGNYLTFVINTPEQLKVVLLSSKTIDKGAFYDFVRPWLGTGLLSAPAPIWKVHRKLLQPTFSSTILKSYVEVFATRSLMVAEKMERDLDGPEFDVYNYTSLFTLHTICDTTMGVDLGAQTKGTAAGNYTEAIEKVLAGICRRAVSPWLHPNFIFNRTRLGRDQKKCIGFLHAFTDDVIQTKKKELLKRSRSADLSDREDTSDRNPRRKVLLDHLIEISGDSKILSDEALRNEVDTIMVAGSDTTAVTSSYVMLMLASHPEVQEKVYRELCEIHEACNDNEELNITTENLARMTYLDRVIKETMRLFPISPILTRLVMEDLQIDERTFPAGSLILLSMIELHRNGEIWPDPLKFDPDRFMPEEVQKRDSFTYLPFSGGPRNCIGAKYAMMSMKTLLTTILRRYVLKKDDIVPVKDLRIKMEFLVRPVVPIKLRIERRI